MHDLHAARDAAIKSARQIVDGAKAEERDLTDAETADVERELAEVKKLDGQIKGRALVDSVKGLHRDEGDPTEEAGDQPAKTLGDHHVKSITGQLGTPLLTEVDQTIVHAFRPGPVVADLLGAGSISGNAVSYFIEGAVEGAFLTVAEGAAKPQMHFVDPTSATDKLTKIAAWWDESDEMVEDLPFMVSEINNRGLYLLSMFEEAQLINGPGTGTTIRGLLNRSGIQTETQAVAPDSAQDAIFRAMTKVQTATGFAADGIIINPADYQALRLSKDANGQYFGGGFFTGPYGVGGVPSQPPLWGLSTVVSTAVAAKTVVVGAFKQAATVYRKGGVRVEQTNSDLGKFTSNIITTRIEERIALAVRVPSAIVKVTVL
jgi:HK97 family phage major capsid protein